MHFQLVPTWHHTTVHCTALQRRELLADQLAQAVLKELQQPQQQQEQQHHHHEQQVSPLPLPSPLLVGLLLMHLVSQRCGHLLCQFGHTNNATCTEARHRIHKGHE